MHLFAEGDIVEVNCTIDLTKEKTIPRLESVVSTKIEQLMDDVVLAAQQKLKTDFLGLGESFHRQHPKQWKSLKSEWASLFPTVTVNVKVKYKIRRIGTINNSFVKDIK